jgi:hypothetical protein
VGLRNVREVCALIDELELPATGEIAVSRGELARGSVYIEKGRVCWAAAQGLARRLTELLGAHASLARGQMESFFVSCRRQNVPLGEHLVARGVLAASDLREALLQHTAESLACLFDVPAHGVWTPRSGKGYSPRFTFTTSELFARVGASTHARQAASLGPLLEETFAGTDWGAAVVRTPSHASPEVVAVWGAIPDTSTSLLRLGQWAASSLDMAGSFSDPEAFISTSRSTAAGVRSVVAFRRGEAVVAGETDEHGPARILNRRAQARRAGGGRGDV